MSDTPVTLIAKSESAENAQEWIDKEPGSLVCTINDSALLLSENQAVDYCVFSHFRLVEEARSTWSRTGLFLSPVVAGYHGGLAIRPMEPLAPEGFPKEKWITNESRYCNSERDLIEEMVRHRQVIWHHTTSAALSWLIATDHKWIRIIGVESSKKGRVKGVGGYQGDWDFNKWLEVNKTICEVATEMRGAKVEWYK